MLFLMTITLFTSRIVLDKLGIENFGIYNVVGGLTSMFIFFQSSLANATQRFLNIELGKNNIKGANDVFCQHLILYLVVSVIIIFLGETIGLWFVYNKLTIPPERLTAAIWVYQFTLISLCITLMGIVFNSEIIAHEDMNIYSYVGIFEGCARLAIAYAISITPFDRLIVYGFLMLFVSLIVQSTYFIYCRKRYQECKLYYIWDKSLFKKTSSIVGWNTLGTAVYAINDSGVNILLNMFFGPVVNAARGISFQINNAVNNFTTNFFVSVRPQIVKSYAQGDNQYLLKLFYNSSKYSFLLLWVLCLSLGLCIDRILHLWLKEVPNYTNIFTLWVFAYSLVNVLNNPVWSVALAVGKLKKYISVGSTVFLLVFPLAYIALKSGYSPVCVFIILFIVRLCYLVVVLTIIKPYINYSVIDYFKLVILPICYVMVLSFIVNFIIKNILPDTQTMMFIFIILSLIVTCISTWLVGISKNEKKYIISILRKYINKNENENN